MRFYRLCPILRRQRARMNLVFPTPAPRYNSVAGVDNAFLRDFKTNVGFTTAVEWENLLKQLSNQALILVEINSDLLKVRT